jgi:hypothetical protein
MNKRLLPSRTLDPKVEMGPLVFAATLIGDRSGDEVVFGD